MDSCGNQYLQKDFLNTCCEIKAPTVDEPAQLLNEAAIAHARRRTRAVRTRARNDLI